ncbi:MAG: hypothetical protein IPK82_42375 [Polyangiaceae bacterium]|nr:hypothetical protein [Polyangiaceae bacterium]
MNAKFIVTGLLTSLLNLILHAAIFFLFLKDFFAAFPSGSEEFRRQLHKGTNDMVLWALLLSALALGYFITLMIRWSRAQTWRAGLRDGLLVGVLYWGGMNFGLYASVNNFSLAGTLMDLVCSALCMAISASFAAWMLGRSRPAASAPAASPSAASQPASV